MPWVLDKVLLPPDVAATQFHLSNQDQLVPPEEQPLFLPVGFNSVELLQRPLVGALSFGERRSPKQISKLPGRKQTFFE